MLISASYNRLGFFLVKLIVFAVIFFNSMNFAQSCVFDGQAMKSLGVSELVNKEILSLFRCSNGHQMWLTNEELDTKKKKSLKSLNLK